MNTTIRNTISLLKTYMEAQEHGMSKTIHEINEKIRQGKAVVATAEEIIDIAREKGLARTAREVDVVTTGTFGPMCSSGAYLNLGHSKPRIKLGGGRGIPQRCASLYRICRSRYYDRSQRSA